MAILASREHLGRPFWQFGTTLEDHRPPGWTRGNPSILVFDFKKLDLLFFGFVSKSLFIDFSVDASTFMIPSPTFSQGKYYENRMSAEVVFINFEIDFCRFVGGR